MAAIAIHTQAALRGLFSCHPPLPLLNSQLGARHQKGPAPVWLDCAMEPATPSPAPTLKVDLVFVHAIWADGLSFGKLIPTLESEGHEVIAAQSGLDTPAGDVLCRPALQALEQALTELNSQLLRRAVLRDYLGGRTGLLAYEKLRATGGGRC